MERGDKLADFVGNVAKRKMKALFVGFIKIVVKADSYVSHTSLLISLVECDGKQFGTSLQEHGIWPRK